MKQTILDALTDGEPQEFHINDSERIMLCEMLAAVSVVLREGKLWFNSPEDEVNEEYAALADSIARRFANMPVETAQ